VETSNCPHVATLSTAFKINAVISQWGVRAAIFGLSPLKPGARLSALLQFVPTDL
jgi:hypothetical protein